MNIYLEEKINKEPYYKRITNDKIINVTGSSGSGKSTFCHQFQNNNYIYIDTDELKDERDSDNNDCQRLKKHIIEKYHRLPDIVTEFPIYYKEILEYFKNQDKILVIDSAQFGYIINDIDLLKGEIYILRTSIDECYKRVLQRWISNHPEYKEEDYRKYKERKKGIYNWYHNINKLIDEIEKL